MKIVVLDGYTLNPGDLSWDGLYQFGEVELYNRTAPNDVLMRAKDAEIVLTNKTVLEENTIRKLIRTRYIGVLATGYNIVDVAAARERHIPVTNVPTYGTQSVAQMVFAHLLNLTQHVAAHANGVSRGKWSAGQDFCYWDYPLLELAGLNMGIVGFGRIGRAVARLAHAFDMNVLCYDLSLPGELPAGVQPVTLEELFRRADVSSLHCPLTPQTHHLVNRQRLALMQSTSFLINTSRGPLVDEQALAEALNSGQIAGAGLDVLSVEPPPPDHPLFNAKNCFITPHIAWATRAARNRLLQTVIENLKAFLDGKPQNVVNP